MCDSALSLLVTTAPVSGLLVSPTPGTFSPAPITLHPSPVNRSHFHTANQHAKTYNTLQHLARNAYSTWLRPHLLPAAAADPHFTGRLLALADSIGPGPLSQPVLSVIRVDYMSDSKGAKPKLVGECVVYFRGTIVCAARVSVTKARGNVSFILHTRF